MPNVSASWNGNREQVLLSEAHHYSLRRPTTEQNRPSPDPLYDHNTVLQSFSHKHTSSPSGRLYDQDSLPDRLGRDQRPAQITTRFHASLPYGFSTASVAHPHSQDSLAGQRSPQQTKTTESNSTNAFGTLQAPRSNLSTTTSAPTHVLKKLRVLVYVAALIVAGIMLTSSLCWRHCRYHAEPTPHRLRGSRTIISSESSYWLNVKGIGLFAFWADDNVYCCCCCSCPAVSAKRDALFGDQKGSCMISARFDGVDCIGQSYLCQYVINCVQTVFVCLSLSLSGYSSTKRECTDRGARQSHAQYSKNARYALN